jgi:hypothetical protein
VAGDLAIDALGNPFKVGDYVSFVHTSHERKLKVVRIDKAKIGERRLWLAEGKGKPRTYYADEVEVYHGK